MVEIHCSQARAREANVCAWTMAACNGGIVVHADWPADRMEFRDGDRVASVEPPGPLTVESLLLRVTPTDDEVPDEEC